MSRCVGESGFASIPSLLGMAAALLVVVVASNLVLIQLSRGALTTAAEAGARAGALLDGSVEDCPRVARAMLDAAPGASLRTSDVACGVESGFVVATATAEADWWIGPFPPVSLYGFGRAPIETRERLLVGASRPSSGSSASP